MSIHLIPILKDNYAYLIEGLDGICAIVDPGDAVPVINFIEARGLRLTHILNTHHHWDHTDGNLEVKEHFGCLVAGPKAEAQRIPGIDIVLSEGDDFAPLGETIQIIETPGHTSGHIALYMPDLQSVFVGDTLFSMGCGRLFEGTPKQMWSSFEKIMTLPDETMMYCGHEYTLANAKFCMQIEPENADIKHRYSEAKDLRRAGLPTLPVSLGTEKKTNVFLRAGSAEGFSDLRTLKDQS